MDRSLPPQALAWLVAAPAPVERIPGSEGRIRGIGIRSSDITLIVPASLQDNDQRPVCHVPS